MAYVYSEKNAVVILGDFQISGFLPGVLKIVFSLLEMTLEFQEAPEDYWACSRFFRFWKFGPLGSFCLGAPVISQSRP